MKIELKHLSLINFKGIKEMSIDFNPLTNILGANETGKSTIMDAFLWLLFGKNAEDQAVFNIKSLNPDGSTKHNLDHEVSGIIEVDGGGIALRRVYKEKWVKKRGDDKTEFSGHETQYYYNDVPLTQSEYKAKIDAILPEATFKLLTNPLHFNTLRWDERRKILFSLVPEKSDKDVAEGIKEFTDLLNDLSGKTFKEYKVQLDNERKLLKKDLEQIPARIDEANRNMPEEPDYKSIGQIIESHKEDLQKIEFYLLDSSKSFTMQNEENQERQNEVYALINKVRDIKNAFEAEKRSKLSMAESESRANALKIKNLLADIKEYNELIEQKETKMLNIEEQLSDLRAKWTARNAETCPEFKDVCPTCKRPFDEAHNQQLEYNWNTQKTKDLEEINKQGKELKGLYEDIKSLISSIREAKEQANIHMDELSSKEFLEPEILMPEAMSKQISEIETKIINLQSQMKPIEKPDNTALVSKKNEIQLLIDGLNKQLSVKDTIDKTKARIQQLFEEEKKYASRIAEIEKILDNMQAFEKAKVDAIEKDVNALFEHVTFRMFNVLINEGIEPCCDCLYKGVPFPDQNTAGKLWSGIDVINILSRCYGISAPCFIDQRESVTLIPKTNCQIINLIVDPSCKQLTIE
jgi:DNA repair protein SbcC/Rad50